MNHPKQTIKNLAKEDRPREKLLSKGKQSLTDSELLAILLNSGSKNESAISLAQRILKDVENDIDKLGEITAAGLMKYAGVGEAKAIHVIAALELGRRRNASSVKQKNSITSSKDAYEFLSAELNDLDHEQFWVILMNVKNQILAKEKIGEGSNTATIVDVKKIFRKVLEFNAVSLIVCHNHPSGEINPSDSDIKLTSNISKSAALLDVKLLDHIIFGKKKYYSFADSGNI